MTTSTTRKTKPAGRPNAAGFAHFSNDCGYHSALRIVAARGAETIGTLRMTHDFNNNFTFANSPAADALVRRACHRLVIGCCGVTRASPEDDKRGIDYWISTGHGRLGLDLKLRTKDYAAGYRSTIDCAIELDGYGTCGWLLKPGGAHLILFACADTGRVAMFEKKSLQTAVMLNVSRWLSDGSAKEIVTDSKRDGRTWKSRAVIVSGELLTQAVDDLGGAANDGA